MAELAVCERIGVSHSHFLGGPVGWTAQDREKALAYAGWRRSVCVGCGTERREWDPEHGGHDEAYIGGLDQCPGCAVLAQEGRNIQAQAADRPDAADGVRPILRHRDSLPRNEDGDVIDDD